MTPEPKLAGPLLPGGAGALFGCQLAVLLTAQPSKDRAGRMPNFSLLAWTDSEVDGNPRSYMKVSFRDTRVPNDANPDPAQASQRS